MSKKRKPIHPGIILNEHYIKPLHLNLQKLAEHLGIARNTLFKLRTGRTAMTPSLALALSRAFDTSPAFWMNLQQKYDLWMAERQPIRVSIKPILKNGILLPVLRNSSLTHGLHA